MQNILQNPIIQGLLTNAIWEWGKSAKNMVEDFALQTYILMQLKSLAKEDNILDTELIEAVRNNTQELSKDLAQIAQSMPEDIKKKENKDEFQEALKSYLKELQITRSFKDINNSNIEIEEYKKIDNSFQNIKDSIIKLG